VFVGNLPWAATETEVQALFASYGGVTNVKIPKDINSGRPRGFAFVTLTGERVEEAIRELNGKDFKGRVLRVNEALGRRERTGNPYEPGGDGQEGGGARPPRRERPPRRAQENSDE